MGGKIVFRGFSLILAIQQELYHKTIPENGRHPTLLEDMILICFIFYSTEVEGDHRRHSFPRENRIKMFASKYIYCTPPSAEDIDFRETVQNAIFLLHINRRIQIASSIQVPQQAPAIRLDLHNYCTIHDS